jgi:hypothetical protein
MSYEIETHEETQEETQEETSQEETSQEETQLEEQITFFQNCYFCQICNKVKNDNFVVLNCNHMFHIKCLAIYHHKNNNTCAYCHHSIDDLELKYIHNKFCKNTTQTIIDINQSIVKKTHKIKKLHTKIEELHNSINQSYYQKGLLQSNHERSSRIVQEINIIDKMIV